MSRGPAQSKAPVFVCGMGRSGTTWISRTLGQSPELSYIGEAWLIGKLEELDDWYHMVSENWGDFTVWKKSGVGHREFLEGLAHFYRGLLDIAAQGQRFIEKTPTWNALHFRFLNSLFPEAYFVLVYRDGRNQIASLEAKKVNVEKKFDFERCCRRWAKAMDVFEEVTLDPTIENYVLVRYEDLVADFDRELVGLSHFLEIQPFDHEPLLPNSSFKDEPWAHDCNRRWESWSAERKETFQRLAGVQLEKWRYVDPHTRW